MSIKVSLVGIAPLEGYHIQQQRYNVRQGGTGVSTYVCYDDKILFSYHRNHSDAFEVHEEICSKWPEWVKAVFDTFQKQFEASL